MTANERAKKELDNYLKRIGYPLPGEESLKKKYLKDFKKRNKNKLDELIRRSENHEILFCANGWTGNIGYPFIMTFNFEIAFDYAFSHGIRNGHPHLARIEYYEIGGKNHYGRPETIDYIGLKES